MPAGSSRPPILRSDGRQGLPGMGPGAAAPEHGAGPGECRPRAGERDPAPTHRRARAQRRAGQLHQQQAPRQRRPGKEERNPEAHPEPAPTVAKAKRRPAGPQGNHPGADREDGTSWLHGHLDDMVRPLLSEPWVLDCDTTIKPLYGHQEGAVVSDNPQGSHERRAAPVIWLLLGLKWCTATTIHVHLDDAALQDAATRAAGIVSKTMGQGGGATASRTGGSGRNRQRAEAVRTAQGGLTSCARLTRATAGPALKP